MNRMKDVEDLARKGVKILTLPIAFGFTWVVVLIVIAIALQVTLTPALVVVLDFFGLGTPNAGRIAGFVILVSVVLSFVATYTAAKRMVASDDRGKEGREIGK